MCESVQWKRLVTKWTKLEKSCWMVKEKNEIMIFVNLYITVARVQPVMDNRLVKRKSLEDNEVDEEAEEMEEVTEGEEEVEVLPEENDEKSNEEMSGSPDTGTMVGSPESDSHEAMNEEVDDSLSLSLEPEESTPQPSPEPEQDVLQPDVEHVQQRRLIKERLPQRFIHFCFYIDID